MILLILFIIIPVFQAQSSNIPSTDIYLSNFTKDDGVKFTSAINDDALGASVKNAGDFNGDGYDDIIIGAEGTNNRAGAVYVVFGSKSGFSDATLSSSMSPNQGTTIYGSDPDDWFGKSVSGAGDVNGDGIDDIIIGAPQVDSSRGFSYIIYGSKNPPAIINLNQGLSPSQGFVIKGADQGHSCGSSVSRIGDFNKDGIDDVIIGAAGTDGKGAGYVIFGIKGSRGEITLVSGLGSNEGFMIKGDLNGGMVGTSVSEAGDMNGDGIDDVILGAPGGSMFAGAVYVIYGKKSNSFSTVDLSQGLSQSEGFSVKMSASLSYFGASVGSAGDFNNDGKADIIIGASLAESNKGAAYVIFGQGSSNSNIILGSGLDPNKGFKILGAKTNDFIGTYVSSAGDINGDGIDDIIVSAYQANNFDGIVYVIFGRGGPAVSIDMSAGLDKKQGFRIIGAKDDHLGTSVSLVGDLNQDGTDDILIGGAGGVHSSGIVYLMMSPIICPENCLTCSNVRTCQTCVEGYVLYNSLCASSCPSSTELINGVCITIKSPGLDTAVEVSKGLFDSGSTASRLFTMGRSLSVGLGLIAKIIQNVRYLNISYSQEALNAFENYGTSLWEPPIPEFLFRSPETKELPSQYSRYDINPTFLENYWQTIMTMLICLVSLLVIKFLQYMTRTHPKGSFFQVALKNLGQTAANFIIVQVYSNIDDVMFFLLLDGSSTKLNSPSARLSLSIAGFFLFIGIALVIFHCWILGKYQQAREKNQLENFKRKFHFIGTLYEDFKDDSAIKQSFFGVLILRCVVLVLVIMLLGPPWIQASLLMLTNLIFLGFLLHQRPYTRLFDEIVQYFCEFTVFAAYLSVLILSILDYKQDWTSSARNGLGKSIVISGIVLCLGGFIVQIIQIAGAIIDIYKFCKTSWNLKKKVSISPGVFELKPSPNSVEVSNGLKNMSRIDNVETLNGPERNHVNPNQMDQFLCRNNDLDISDVNSENTLIIDQRNSKRGPRTDSSQNKLQDENIPRISQRLGEDMRLQGSPHSFGNRTERDSQLGQISVLSLESEMIEKGKNSRKYRKFKRKPRLPIEFTSDAL